MERAYIKVYNEDSPEEIIEETEFEGEGAHRDGYRHWKDLWERKYVGQVAYASCERDFNDFTLGEVILKQSLELEAAGEAVDAV